MLMDFLIPAFALNFPKRAMGQYLDIHTNNFTHVIHRKKLRFVPVAGFGGSVLLHLCHPNSAQDVRLCEAVLLALQTPFESIKRQWSRKHVPSFPTNFAVLLAGGALA